MPAQQLSEKIMRETLAAMKTHGTQKKAAAALKVNQKTFQARLDRARLWAAGGEAEIKGDPLEVRGLKDKLSHQGKALKELEKFNLHEKTIREAAFNLAAMPMMPPNWSPRPSRGQKSETILLPLSDVHMGEVVDLAAMGGRNSYNVKIARDRLERYFSHVVKLSTEHWSGLPPDCIYLCLMGDMVSGEIHDELAKTNELHSIPAVRLLVEYLAAGIDLLQRTFPKIPIHVVSVPGNHSRTVRKPEAKRFAIESYDTLVAWMLESYITAKGYKNISFSTPASGDALLTIHGWNILVTHGDRIGSRGGQGFIGPAATATRGMKRTIEDYLAEGQVVDWVVMGHLHSPLRLEYGFVNGSLPGPTEYSRSGRFKSHPSSQWMLTIHPTHGIARQWLVQCGDPSEGSIYKGRVS